MSMNLLVSALASGGLYVPELAFLNESNLNLGSLKHTYRTNM